MPSLSIYSPPTQEYADAKVCNLIDKNIGGWDLNIMARLFQDEEVKAIISIPLSRTDQEDKLIWEGTTNGLFSVESAYHLAKEMEDKNKAECSKSTWSSGVWKRLWKLKIPNVEKNFL